MARDSWGVMFRGQSVAGLGLEITQEGSPPGQALADAFKARMHNLAEEGEQRMARAHTGAMRQVTEAFLARLRDDIVTGGFHNAVRLSKTWRGVVFPRGGHSMEAAGYFWTKARTIVEAFDSGVTIRAAGGRFLAIPVGPAKAIVRRMNRADNRRRDFRGRFDVEDMPVARVEAALGTELTFIPSRRGGGGVLVARGRGLTRTGRDSRGRTAGRDTVLFVLLRQATLKRRIRGRALLEQLAREFPHAFAAALAAQIGSETA